MRTNIDVKDKIFDALNVTSVKDFIAGTLYNGKRPAAQAVEEDITLPPLPIDDEYVQTATINVNCFVEDIAEGVPDYSRINEIFKVVETALLQYSSTEYFDIQIAAQMINDSEISGWSFLNIRLICQILKS